jgi:hypothetical protein
MGFTPLDAGNAAGVGNVEACHAKHLAAFVADRRRLVATHAAGAHLMRARDERPVSAHACLEHPIAERVDVVLGRPRRSPNR